MNVEPASIVLAILILGFLIAIHEAGHMLVARWVGMRVLKYSVGFGPVLWKRTWGETTYQLAAIPFGGFVQIDGQLPTEEYEDQDDPRLFQNKSVWARAAVIFAGPATNYLFAFVMAGIVYASCGTAYYNYETGKPYPLKIDEVVKGKAADAAGLRKGDIITHVDGFPVRHILEYKYVIRRQREGFRYQPDKAKREALKTFHLQVQRDGKELVVSHPLAKGKNPLAGLTLEDVPKGGGARVKSVKPPATGSELKPGDVVVRIGDRPIRQAEDLQFQAFMAKDGFYWAGKDRWKVSLWIKRGKKRFKLDVKPNEQTGEIGVRFELRIVWVRKGVLTDLGNGLMYPIKQSEAMLGGLGKLLKFDKQVAASAKGPVGIVTEVQQRLSAGTSEALLIVILLSVLLGLFNLLPIPALDGGQLLFRLIEAITRWRMDPAREMRIHTYGFYALVVLMIILTVRDVRGCLGL